MTIRIRSAISSMDSQTLAALLTPVLLSQPSDEGIDGTHKAKPGTTWIRWCDLVGRPGVGVTLD